MNGSTLHRSGLTREKMNVLANISHPVQDKKQAAKIQLNQYYRATKSKEIDMLWNGVQKGVQKVHNVAKSSTQKSPAAYLTIGFVAGVIFTCLIVLTTSLFAMNPQGPKEDESNVAIISETAAGASSDVVTSEEKYVVKKGDTLNGIAYRFYGKYDEAKILEIQRINNIANPASISIGQELIIPVSQIH